ncbi:MAG: hypothetical protein ACN0LA_01520 [Candidatus Longimicrobiales bacterium M2_2A_002]
MMMNRRIERGLRVGAILALAVAVVPVTAQQSGQDTDPRLERIRAELPQGVLERVEARIAAARSEGIPVEPLMDKAVEGIAKQVPGPRVAEAVDRLARELGRAKQLLSDGVPPTPTDVSAVADAMRRGVPEPAIQRIAQGARADEPVALAVHTMGDLMDRGVPVEQAVAVLEAWRGRGARSEELRELPGAVERLIRQGVLPGQAAAAVANAMRGGPQGASPGGEGQPPGMMQGGPPIPPGSGPPDDRGKGPKIDPPGQGGGPGGGD